MFLSWRTKVGFRNNCIFTAEKIPGLINGKHLKEPWNREDDSGMVRHSVGCQPGVRDARDLDPGPGWQDQDWYPGQAVSSEAWERGHQTMISRQQPSYHHYEDSCGKVRAKHPYLSISLHFTLKIILHLLLGLSVIISFLHMIVNSNKCVYISKE